MNRTDLVARIAAVLRERDTKKSVIIPRHVFHISDDEGNHKDFVVKGARHRTVYTKEDIDAFIGALIVVIQEAMRNGEPIHISGIGTLNARYHRPRTLKKIGTGEEMMTNGNYIPKFTPAENLRMCASMYGQSLFDKEMRNLKATEDDDGNLMMTEITDDYEDQWQ